MLTAALAVGAFVAALVLTPDTSDPKRHRLDLPGSILSGLGIGGLVFGIIEGSEQGWTDALAVAGYLVAIAGTVGYVAWATRAEHPLLDPRLFRLPGVSAGSVALVAQFLATFGFLYVSMQFLLLILGYSPLRSALALMPMALVLVPLAQSTPRLVDRFGTRAVMLAGLGALVGGLLLLSTLDERSGYLSFLGGLVVFGAGMALASTPATTAIVGSLPSAKQGVASAVNDATREIGAALGIALMVSLYGTGYEDAVGTAFAGLPAEQSAAATESPAAGLAAAGQLGGDEGAQLADSVRSALMDGFSRSLVAGAAVVAVAMVFVVVRAARPAVTDHQPGTGAEADETHERDGTDEADELEGRAARAGMAPVGPW